MVDETSTEEGRGRGFRASALGGTASAGCEAAKAPGAVRVGVCPGGDTAVRRMPSLNALRAFEDRIFVSYGRLDTLPATVRDGGEMIESFRIQEIGKL